MSSLYIDRRGVRLSLESSALIVYEQEQRQASIPLAPIERIFVRGDVQLNSSLLGKLGELGIGLIVLSGRKAETSLLMARPHNDAQRRVQQYRCFLDPAFRLSFSRQLIQQKLHSQRELLEHLLDRYPQQGYQIRSTLKQLQQHLHSLEQADSLGSIRGLEGATAANYFGVWADILPTSLQFKGRNRRPPKDPFNAVLSLGYSLLHAETVLALYGAGLDPFIGFFHELNFGRESLVCDLLEPWRVEVDRFSQKLFSLKQLRVEDFSQTESGCLLGKAGRARYYQSYEALAEGLRQKLTEQISTLIADLQAYVTPIEGLPCTI